MKLCGGIQYLQDKLCMISSIRLLDQRQACLADKSVQISQYQLLATEQQLTWHQYLGTEAVVPGTVQETKVSRTFLLALEKFSRSYLRLKALATNLTFSGFCGRNPVAEYDCCQFSTKSVVYDSISEAMDIDRLYPKRALPTTAKTRTQTFRGFCVFSQKHKKQKNIPRTLTSQSKHCTKLSKHYGPKPI